jgi:hypothetical protein
MVRGLGFKAEASCKGTRVFVRACVRVCEKGEGLLADRVGEGEHGSEEEEEGEEDAGPGVEGQQPAVQHRGKSRRQQSQSGMSNSLGWDAGGRGRDSAGVVVGSYLTPIASPRPWRAMMKATMGPVAPMIVNGCGERKGVSFAVCAECVTLATHAKRAGEASCRSRVGVVAVPA